MREAILTITTTRVPTPELIDLSVDPDGALFRLCALLGRLQSLAAELESITASLPARTILGRRMREIAL